MKRTRSPYVAARLAQIRAEVGKRKRKTAFEEAERVRDLAFWAVFRTAPSRPPDPGPPRRVPQGSKLGIALTDAEAEGLIAGPFSHGCGSESRPNMHLWKLAVMHGLDPGSYLKGRRGRRL
jgi:hypothetical protein